MAEEYRKTRQRDIILEVLKGMKTHPTVDEVYDMVKKQIPRISLATVYRNLEKLAENNMAQVIVSGARQMRYDGDMSEHHHIRCAKCGKVADVWCKGPLDIETTKLDFCGFKVTGYSMLFEGLCPECAKEAHKDTTHCPKGINEELSENNNKTRKEKHNGAHQRL